MSETQPKMAIRTSSKPIATEYNVMFDRDITSPEEWQEELYALREAGEKDTLNIIVNTVGGSAATVSAFKSIKDKSLAHWHGILEGTAYSAGSAFFLMCDTQEVGEFSDMMIHTSQGTGFYTHSQGREDYGKQTARTARKLVETVYADFLSPEEIEDVLKGSEIWLDSDQIKARLEKRDELRNQRDLEEFNKQYDARRYAQELMENLITEVEGLDFTPEDVVAELKNLPPDHQTEMESIPTENVDIDSEQNIEVLKTVANDSGIKFAHNIGIETLRQRILENMNED